MKKLLIVLLVVPVFVSAQQQQKQIQRLLEQIVANKLYIGYLEKGYKIVHSGLQTIQGIKKGDFNLHFDFFDSLQKVNPKIKTYGRVAEIISFQLQIIKRSKEVIKETKGLSQFTGEELSYCQQVFTNLLDECANNIDELLMIVVDGKVTMKDNERLRRIDKLYNDMQDKYAFTSNFSEEMGMLAAQRISEQTDINYSKILR